VVKSGHDSLRQLIADAALGDLSHMQLAVALRAAANALQKITRLPDAVKTAPQEIKQAKYLAQMALQSMDKAALDFGLDEGSEVKKIKDERKASGSWHPCQGCGTSAKCIERRICNAERAETLQRAREGRKV
jgi:hypothetical protein